SPAVALLGGLAGGLIGGAAFATVAVAGRADPILVGTAWNVVAFGGTAFGYRLLAGATGAVLEVPRLAGGALGLAPAVWAGFALPVLVHAGLRLTRPGLRLAAAGENPEALHAQGLSVVAVRAGASFFAGATAGLAGALLVVTVSPTFVEGMTAGRGFLALALVVFARWKPLRLVPATLLIGAASALQVRLQAAGSTAIPYAFFVALPPLLALLALTVSPGRGGAPKALGAPAP
ncbi:MAG TPA: ABC transporter permease, partial [Thermoanaerobaculia bacterium]|nr:ABC transporter permease [Thermoanaerobaculia bacterium]